MARSNNFPLSRIVRRKCPASLSQGLDLKATRVRRAYMAPLVGHFQCPAGRVRLSRPRPDRLTVCQPRASDPGYSIPQPARSDRAWVSHLPGNVMRIRVGCEMTYELEQATPMIVMLNVHASRVSDLERPDYLVTIPSVPIEGYRDSFGNWCTRLVAPSGRFGLKTETIVRDSGQLEAADLGAEQHQVQDLPAETLGEARGLPRLRPSGSHVLPLLEHPSALLHGLRQRYRPSAAPCANGFRRLDRGLSRRPVAQLRSSQQRSADRPNLDRARSRRR
jgi:hypothetical protein